MVENHESLFLDEPLCFDKLKARAVWEGRKTQVRAPIQARPDNAEDAGKFIAACPYGKIGEVVYGCEPWGLLSPVSTKFDKYVFSKEKKRSFVLISDYWDGGDTVDGYAIYAADGSLDWDPDDPCWQESGTFRWYPASLMPQKASRLPLLIKDIRVEILQNIKWQDAQREGISVKPPKTSRWNLPKAFNDWAEKDQKEFMLSLKNLETTEFQKFEDKLISEFHKHWDSMYASKSFCWTVQSWWVYVIDFELVSKP